MAEKKLLKKDQLNRIINYYEIIVTPHSQYNLQQSPVIALMNAIIGLAKEKSNRRYRKVIDKFLLIQDCQVIPAEKVVTGKLRCIRKDIFPELFNTDLDEARDILADENDGIVDTTHFCLDYSKHTPRLGLEFNYQGAKIVDFVNYLFATGQREKICSKVEFFPIVKGNLEAETKKLNRCAEFTVKIHRDRIEEVKKLDKKLFSALAAAKKSFESEYIKVTANYDYKHVAKTSEVSKLIRKLGKLFYKDPDIGNTFEAVHVRAEDPDRGNKIEAFDLLLDKVRSQVFVLKKQKSRTVMSEDMYVKIKSEMKRLKI
jgi:hypothetical protein